MSKASGTDARGKSARLALYHVLLLGGVFAFWYLMTEPLLWSEEAARNTAFFFGKPLIVLEKTWDWFASGKIYEHLLVTLIETLANQSHVFSRTIRGLPKKKDRKSVV